MADESKNETSRRRMRCGLSLRSQSTNGIRPSRSRYIAPRTAKRQLSCRLDGERRLIRHVISGNVKTTRRGLSFCIINVVAAYNTGCRVPGPIKCFFSKYRIFFCSQRQNESAATRRRAKPTARNHTGHVHGCFCLIRKRGTAGALYSKRRMHSGRFTINSRVATPDFLRSNPSADGTLRTYWNSGPCKPWNARDYANTYVN